MIIVRTPYRISFFGGGTDYPAWYRENGGAVLSTTIDKYCYINCRYLPPFFTYKHGIVYSKYEMVNEIDEIVHPAVREVFRHMKVECGLQIHHDGDLPARSGIGSSSTFTVGLLHALYGLRGVMVSKKRLMMEAIHVEQDMIRENVGSQDQAAAAFGGLNRIEFSGSHNIEVRPVILPRERLNELQDHMMLFFTGITRFASDVAKEKINQLPKRAVELRAMREMVDQAIGILGGEGDITEFGRLLDEGWRLKRLLSSGITNSVVDDIYDTAVRCGAEGGKILGAGGGGFILFFVKPERQEALRTSLSKLLHVPFSFESLGSQIIYYSEGGV